MFETMFFPRNVHKIKEFKCFSELIMLVIQHFKGQRKKCE